MLSDNGTQRTGFLVLRALLVILAVVLILLALRHYGIISTQTDVSLSQIEAYYCGAT